MCDNKTGGSESGSGLSKRLRISVPSPGKIGPRNQSWVRYMSLFCLLSWFSGQSCSGQVSDAAPAGITLLDQSATAPVVIAHRGASGYLPEHTTEAAVMAYMMGAEYLEQDCVLSKDGIPVVLHDLTLDDITNVAELYADRKRADGHWYVMDFSLSELRTLRLTERRSPGRAWKNSTTRFPLEQGSFRISTLEEHLQLIQGMNRTRGRNTGVYVEIKDPVRHREAGMDASTIILSILKKYGYDSADAPVFVQCFEESEVRRIRNELKSPLPLIWLVGKAPTPEKIREAAGFCDGIGALLTLVVTGTTPEGDPKISDVVSVAHSEGLQVHVWTFRADAMPEFVDNPETLLEWLTVDAGVDGIFADQPDIVVRWRDARIAAGGQGNPFRLLNSKAPDTTPKDTP